MSVLANELLLGIFAHMDRHTLLRVALANRTFSHLARTFLFSHLDGSRYVTCLKEHEGDPVSASQLLQLSRYLDFWTSEEIAPHVRSCEISPQLWFDLQVAVPQLLAMFFDHIARFTGLRRLNLSNIQLTGLAVSTLVRLPMLSELILESCEVANGDSMPSVSNVLRLCHFSYISSKRVEEWLPMLEPSCLRVLHTGAAPHNSAVIPVFPYVHDLSVCIHKTPTPADITFLRKLPGVTKLNMDLNWTRSRRSPLATLPADVLPVLTDFIGPICALPLFLARDTLKRIETDEEASLDDFVIELQRIPAPLTNLIHLTATFNSFCTGTALDAIFESLPRLEDVEITFADYESDFLDPAPAEILSKLPSIHGISPHLRHLSLIWKSLDDVTVDYIESECDFPAVRAALVAQCPDLKVLWLDGRDFIFCWHTQADNMDETEVMVTDPKDVNGVRFGWEVLRQLPQLVYEDVYEDEDAFTASTFDYPTVLTFINPAVRKMSFNLGDINASVISTTPLTSFHVTPTSTVDGSNIGGVNTSESSANIVSEFSSASSSSSLGGFSVGGLNGSSSASTTPFSEFSEAITRAGPPNSHHRTDCECQLVSVNVDIVHLHGSQHLDECTAERSTILTCQKPPVCRLPPHAESLVLKHLFRLTLCTFRRVWLSALLTMPPAFASGFPLFPPTTFEWSFDLPQHAEASAIGPHSLSGFDISTCQGPLRRLSRHFDVPTNSSDDPSLCESGRLAASPRLMFWHPLFEAFNATLDDASLPPAVLARVPAVHRPTPTVVLDFRRSGVSTSSLDDPSLRAMFWPKPSHRASRRDAAARGPPAAQFPAYRDAPPLRAPHQGGAGP
ncbi:hypothetical protein GGX14DRAFT_565270 [Mycena pura]|uniref:F-box domain-containing protein n=1 Tax=Mycena pura TaxID=153505 RepID=A0AAD6YI43_9AGAR|nr:hypothetical protein GGX14DRAFT_565270 [Mycena pura]